MYTILIFGSVRSVFGQMVYICTLVIELLIKCDRDGKNERSVKYSCRIWVLLDQGGVDLGKDCAVGGCQGSK